MAGQRRLNLRWERRVGETAKARQGTDLAAVLMQLCGNFRWKRRGWETAKARQGTDLEAAT